MKNSDPIFVERLKVYSPDDAAGIGRLMPFLSKRLSGDPIKETYLRDIIDSPHHDQIVARIEARIVGSATLGTLMGTANGRQGWLNDFVTDPDTNGVGSRIWNEITAWCKEREITRLNFVSHPDRITAKHFYEARGGQVAETSFWFVDMN